MTSSSGPWVARWLSTPRFDVYVAACGGDRQRALSLYEWNTRVAAELMHDVAHLEVGLRDAYDEAILQHRNGSRNLDHRVGVLRRLEGRSRSSSAARVAGSAMPVTAM